MSHRRTLVKLSYSSSRPHRQPTPIWVLVTTWTVLSIAGIALLMFLIFFLASLID